MVNNDKLADILIIAQTVFLKIVLVLTRDSSYIFKVSNYFQTNSVTGVRDIKENVNFCSFSKNKGAQLCLNVIQSRDT